MEYDGLIKALLMFRLARDGYKEWRDRDVNRAKSMMTSKEISRGVWAAAQAYNKAEESLKAEILKAADLIKSKP